jgi:cation:H+ antiporter
MEYLYLIAGFVLLLYGGKFLVKGGVALANRFNVSSLVIGLTVVSFGTSAPELFVSLVAAIKNYPEVAIGNVIGSNIANIALVLALTALIIPIPVRSASVRIDAPFMIAVSFLVWILMLNGILGRFEGLIFIIFLMLYITGLLWFSKKNKPEVREKNNAAQMSLGKIIFLLIIADTGLAFGSDLLVTNASIIAADLGISQRVIAITLVAFGTSLPELTTSVIAALKKEMDISIGNIIGSNIFNILAVLGITSIVKPIPVSQGFLTFDIFWMIGFSVLLLFFILPLKGGILSRPKALILFAGYCIYVYLLYFSGK